MWRSWDNYQGYKRKHLIFFLKSSPENIFPIDFLRGRQEGEGEGGRVGGERENAEERGRGGEGKRGARRGSGGRRGGCKRFMSLIGCLPHKSPSEQEIEPETQVCCPWWEIKPKALGALTTEHTSPDTFNFLPPMAVICYLPNIPHPTYFLENRIILLNSSLPSKPIKEKKPKNS